MNSTSSRKVENLMVSYFAHVFHTTNTSHDARPTSSLLRPRSPWFTFFECSDVEPSFFLRRKHWIQGDFSRILHNYYSPVLKIYNYWISKSLVSQKSGRKFRWSFLKKITNEKLFQNFVNLKEVFTAQKQWLLNMNIIEQRFSVIWIRDNIDRHESEKISCIKVSNR